MSKHSSSAIYQALATLFLKYPGTFLRSINVDNLIALRSAVQNESPVQIVRNLNAYFTDISIESRDRRQIINESFFPRLKQIPQDREVILLISHEATRTGAPKLILRLADYLMKHYPVQPIFILCRGGVMQREFAERYPTYIFDGMSPSARDMAKALRLIKKISGTRQVNKAIVNSAESRFILPALRPHGFQKIVTMIHELASLSEPQGWNGIGDISDMVVFPVEVVRKEAFRHNSFDTKKTRVLGQGLLDQSIYAFSSAGSRLYVRKELNLPQDAKIVLGCGQAIRRKGPDLFLFTALAVLNQYTGSQPLYFVWLGAEPKGGLQTWMKIDLGRGAHSHRIRFIGQRENVNHYFTGSDVFFLSSRGDPHPCVVHEATAAGLPVVAFANSGGVAEMVFEENSHLVPYADISSAADAILRFLAEDSEGIREKTIKYAKTHFDFHIYAEKIYQLISDEESEPALSVSDAAPALVST